MRTSERTLLRDLGFSDPDKKNRRHDWACQYVCQPEVFGKMMVALSGGKIEQIADLEITPEYYLAKGEDRFKKTIGFLDAYATYSFAATFDAPSAIGCLVRELEAQHDFEKDYFIRNPSIAARLRNLHADFADNTTWKERSAIESSIREAWQDHKTSQVRDWLQKRQEADTECGKPIRVYLNNLHAIIEVKIKRSPIGDVMRQLRLYMEYTSQPTWRGDTRYVAALREDAIAAGWEHVCREECGPSCDKVDYVTGKKLRATCERPRWREFLDGCRSKLIDIAPARCVLVTDYDVDAVDTNMLRDAGIAHVRLGKSFDRYVHTRESTSEGGGSILI